MRKIFFSDRNFSKAWKEKPILALNPFKYHKMLNLKVSGELLLRLINFSCQGVAFDSIQENQGLK